MKTLIELLIAALVLHGCVTMGGAVWRNFKFKDAVEQETRFAGTAPIEALHQRIMELAEEHEVALEPVDVVIERRGLETVVATKYTETVPLAFGFYPREHQFAFEVRARVIAVR